MEGVQVTVALSDGTEEVFAPGLGGVPEDPLTDTGPSSSATPSTRRAPCSSATASGPGRWTRPSARAWASSASASSPSSRPSHAGRWTSVVGRQPLARRVTPTSGGGALHIAGAEGISGNDAAPPRFDRIELLGHARSVTGSSRTEPPASARPRPSRKDPRACRSPRSGRRTRGSRRITQERPRGLLLRLLVHVSHGERPFRSTPPLARRGRRRCRGGRTRFTPGQSPTRVAPPPTSSQSALGRRPRRRRAGERQLSTG